MIVSHHLPYLSLGRNIGSVVLDRKNKVLYYLDTPSKTLRSFSLPDKKDRVVFANLQDPKQFRYIPRTKSVEREIKVYCFSVIVDSQFNNILSHQYLYY